MVKNIIIAALAVGLLFMTLLANLNAKEAKENASRAVEAEAVAGEAAGRAMDMQAESVRAMEKAQAELKRVYGLIEEKDLGEAYLLLQKKLDEVSRQADMQFAAAEEAAAEAVRQESLATLAEVQAVEARDEAEKQRLLAEEMSQKAKAEIEQLKKELEICKSKDQ